VKCSPTAPWVEMPLFHAAKGSPVEVPLALFSRLWSHPSPRKTIG
jgi:hypothetical protein